MGNVIVEMGKFFLRKYPEIVADATNSLALHIADMRRKEQLPAAKPGCFCTVHRHVRSQEIKGLMQAFQSLFREVFIQGGGYTMDAIV